LWGKFLRGGGKFPWRGKFLLGIFGGDFIYWRMREWNFLALFGNGQKSNAKKNRFLQPKIRATLKLKLNRNYFVYEGTHLSPPVVLYHKV